MIVPCTSELMDACRNGNERAARHLIDSKQASPYDRCAECHCQPSRPCFTDFFKGETALFASLLLLVLTILIRHSSLLSGLVILAWFDIFWTMELMPMR